MLSVESNWAALQDLGVAAFGISCDNPDSLHPWAAALGCLSFPLLGDFWPHGEVCARYGVLNEHGVPDRVVVAIRPDGVVAYVGEWQPSEQMRPVLEAFTSF